MTDITSGEGDENPSMDQAPPHLSTAADVRPKYGRAPAFDETGCQRCGWVHLRCSGHVDRPKGLGAYMTPCGRRASEGGTVCAAHGGRAPQVRRKAAERLALGRARAELEREGRLGGGQIDVDPADAMLAMVREAAFNVAVLRDLVAGLATEMDAAAPDALGPVPAIAGLMGSTSKVMEAAPHVWVNMYDAERERLVKWSKACRDAGVDEAVVRLEGRRADQLAGILRGIEASLLALVLAAVPEGTVAAVRGAWQVGAPRVIEAELRKVGEA